MARFTTLSPRKSSGMRVVPLRALRLLGAHQQHLFLVFRFHQSYGLPCPCHRGSVSHRSVASSHRVGRSLFLDLEPRKQPSPGLALSRIPPCPSQGTDNGKRGYLTGSSGRSTKPTVFMTGGENLGLKLRHSTPNATKDSLSRKT